MTRYAPKVLFVFALVVLIFVLLPPLVGAAPPIAWTPGRIDQTLKTGVPVKVTVSFIASEDLGNVTVQVVPELKPFVSVDTPGLANITKGATVQVPLTMLAAPGLRESTVDGTIHLRPAAGKQGTIAKPLPVTLHIAEFVDADADSNGVWDYIDTYINTDYANEPGTQKALRQFAKAYQQYLQEANDKIASIKNSDVWQKGFECLHYITPEDGPAISREFEAKVMNTVERSRAYLKATEQLAGSVTHATPLSELRKTCQWLQN